MILSVCLSSINKIEGVEIGIVKMNSVPLSTILLHKFFRYVFQQFPLPNLNQVQFPAHLPYLKLNAFPQQEKVFNIFLLNSNTGIFNNKFNFCWSSNLDAEIIILPFLGVNLIEFETRLLKTWVRIPSSAWIKIFSSTLTLIEIFFVLQIHIKFLWFSN